MVYWTDDSDLGHKLELQCIPCDHNGRSGEPSSIITASVLPSPSLSAISHRHQHTQQYLSLQDELRVVSYNILAEYYSSTDYAKQVLYPYCQPDALLISYRQCLLARELIGYHADILCLQEVGKKCFEKFLLPVMRDSGYDGWFAQKTGQVIDLSIFPLNISFVCRYLKERHYFTGVPSSKSWTPLLFPLLGFLQKIKVVQSYIQPCEQPPQ